jgi:hypothetical protein
MVPLGKVIPREAPMTSEEVKDCEDDETRSQLFDEYCIRELLKLIA